MATREAAMSNSDFERVKKLAEQLSPKHRLRLFGFLRDLLDTQSHTLPPTDGPRLLTKQETVPQDRWNWSCKSEGNEATYYLEGVEVFRAVFQPENYVAVLFEKLKSDDSFIDLSDEQRQRLLAPWRETFAKQGTILNEEQIKQIEAEVLSRMVLKVLKESIEHSAKQMNDNLGPAMAIVLRKVIEASLFSGANQLSNILEMPEEKYRAGEIKKRLFQWDWKRLKPITGATAGGAHNVGHPWTDEDRACLTRKYEELHPIWLDAKEITRRAQKSKVESRRKAWRKEVLRAYPDLPTDLLDSFSTLRGSARPSDNAVIHASRECRITVQLSPRQLKNIISAWKLKTTLEYPQKR